MGIMSSKDVKPESKSGNSQVPSRSVIDHRLQVFMKGGGCEESYKELMGSPEKERKYKYMEARWMLEKCMKARYDYFQPYLSIDKVGTELMLREMDGFLHAKPKNRDKLFDKFMKKGGCKEEYMAWSDSCEEARKTKGRHYTPAWDNMCKCMEAHSDHYQPMLTAVKNFEEHYSKELKALLDAREKAEAEAKG